MADSTSRPSPTAGSSGSWRAAAAKNRPAHSTEIAASTVLAGSTACTAV
jgi:hypothetical protein